MNVCGVEVSKFFVSFQMAMRVWPDQSFSSSLFCIVGIAISVVNTKIDVSSVILNLRVFVLYCFINSASVEVIAIAIKADSVSEKIIASVPRMIVMICRMLFAESLFRPWKINVTIRIVIIGAMK